MKYLALTIVLVFAIVASLFLPIPKVGLGLALFVLLAVVLGLLMLIGLIGKKIGERIRKPWGGWLFKVVFTILLINFLFPESINQIRSWINSQVKIPDLSTQITDVKNAALGAIDSALQSSGPILINTFSSTKPAAVAAKQVEATRDQSCVGTTTDILNARAEPNTNSEIKGKLSKGSRINIISHINKTWLKVTWQGLNSQTYWVSAQYVVLDNSCKL